MMLIRLRRFLLAAAVIIGATASGYAQCNSSVVLVSQRTVAPNLNAHATAWSGARLGVAKVDGLNAARPIYFATYDADLQQLSADIKIADASFNGVLALLWNGSEFGLFYQQPSFQLAFQRISAAGQPIGFPIAIAPHHPNFPQDEYDVTWDSFRKAYDVVRTISEGPQSGLWLMFVNPDGSLRSEQTLTLFQAQPAEPRIAATADGTIGVIFRHITLRAISLARLDKNDAVLLQQRISANENGRIAARNSGFVILTSSHDISNRGVINWTRVEANGSIIDETPLFVSASQDVAPIALLWNASRDEWALSYLDAQFGFKDFPASYRLRRFRANGALISDTLFSADSLRNTATTRYPFSTSGLAYFSAVELFVSVAQGSDSYLLRYCPLTASISTNTPLPRPNDTITFTAIVAGGAPGYTYLWNFGDLSDPQTGVTATHRYEKEGTYIVTLTVTDSQGAQVVVTREVKVKIPKLRVTRK